MKKGTHLSKEARKKISIAHLGQPGGMFGRHHSQETKIKMSGDSGEYHRSN
jgi:hypothetical protein